MSNRSCNILIVGQTGVGKSSLINYLTETQSAKVAVGRPVTTKDDLSSYSTTFSDIPVCLFDSWGIETDKVGDWKSRIKAIIKQHNGSSNDVGASWFHSIIYCIASGNSRVQPIDEEMISFFYNEGFSVVVALTKADLASDNDLQELSAALPQALFSVPISAGGKTRYHIIEGFGKERLLSAIMMESLTNLPCRVGKYASGLIQEWDRSMNTQLNGKDISRFDNAAIESWIRSSSSAFAEQLKDKITHYIGEELNILTRWNALTSRVDDVCAIHIITPKTMAMSSGEIAVAIVFAPITIVIGLLYGLFCGVDDERKKLQLMISQATSQFNDYAHQRQANLTNTMTLSQNQEGHN